MPHFSTTRRVNLTPDQAYAIAADVSSYKDFIPLLKRSVIRGERKVENGVESFHADLVLVVPKVNMTESFTSHVTADASAHSVTATSSDGPLKSLKAVWKISPCTDGKADVSITLDYTLKNMMLQMMAGGFMDFAAQKIMQAFEDRGRALYGSAIS
jgi:coenzyme Q-binding protein COQ10